MTIRSTLKTTITSNIAAYAAYGVNSELPFDDSGTPLHIKNMKRVYLDKEQATYEPYIKTLRKDCNLDAKVTTLSVYVTTDAKVIPTDIDAVISAIVAAKRSISTIDTTTEVTTEISDDYITYTIEFGFTELVAT